jgi:DNA modification methylase
VSDLKILQGDCVQSLKQLADESVQCCVTSPPYFGLRDYGHDGQIGLEPTPDDYVAKIVEVFREVRRVIRKDGTLWLNLGDSYASFRDGKAVPDSTRGDDTGTLVPKGSAKNRMASTFRGTAIKHKDLIGIPWRVAFALQGDGWYLRQDIIWHKPNPMPESVQDRCTKAHEYIFLLSKSDRYFYDAEAIAQPLTETSKARLAQPNLANQQGSDRVPGKTNGNMKAVGPRFGGNKYGDDDREESRTKSGNVWDDTGGMANRRSVWTIATQPYKEAHFATFPVELPRLCILAGSRAGDVMLDPFGGSGTTGQVALELGRSAILCELNPKYVELIRHRCTTTIGLPL